MRWGKCHKQLKLWREGGREGADPQNCTRLSVGPHLDWRYTPHTAGWVVVYASAVRGRRVCPPRRTALSHYTPT